MTDASTRQVVHELETQGITVFRRLGDFPQLETPIRLEAMLVVLCLKGEISATVDLKQRVMTPPSIMALRPGHMINNLHVSEDFDGFFVLAGMEKLTAILPTLSRMIPCALHYMANPIIEITPEEAASQQLNYRVLRQKINAPHHIYHNLMISAMCELIFYETLGIYTSHMNTRHFSPTRRQELILKFIDMVERDFRRERTVIYYAGQLCVTPKHLSAVVKEASGRTAGEWIDDMVILEAKQLLHNSSMTIQEISNELNFPNQSFFGKYFKHHTGMSPRRYRSTTPQS